MMRAFKICSLGLHMKVYVLQVLFRSRLTDIDKKLVVTSGERGGYNIEVGN